MNMKGQVSTANFPDRAKRKVEGAAKPKPAAKASDRVKRMKELGNC